MLRLEPLSEERISACAELHLSAFPDFFLSQLGPRFLREFYAGFAHDRDAVTVVCVDPSDRLLGVAVGTLNPSGFFKRLLLRRWYAFAVASIALLIRRPRHLPRLLRAVIYRGHVPEVNASGALLSSICVAPDSQGLGVGSQLLRQFERHVDAAGVPLFLTTDRDGNDEANHFYRRHGWRLAGSFSTPQGRPMNCYVHYPPEEARR